LPVGSSSPAATASRLTTLIASQTGPAHGLAELADRVAAALNVNRLASNARMINFGQMDMWRHGNDQARAHEASWVWRRSGPCTGPLSSGQNCATNCPDWRYHQALLAMWGRLAELRRVASCRFI
jgi:hypothetical protein